MTEHDRFHMGLCVVWWSFLLVAGMCLMLVTASHKVIVIADGTYGQEMTEDGEEVVRRQRIAIEDEGDRSAVFSILLEKNTRPENVVVENRYMEKELHILIKGAHEEFFAQSRVRGDAHTIREAFCEKKRNGVLLKLRMDSVREYQTSLDGDTLKIRICDPHELYRLLVVIDPAGGGPVGNNPDMKAYRDQIAAQIVLDVCKRLPGELNSENVRIYFTRTEDEEVAPERRAALAEEVGADLFLRVATAADEDAGKYGIQGWYNETYVLPEFGNAEFADIVTRNVAIASSNRAVGLMAAGEESVLQAIRVPAAGVDLGYMSNVQENALLSQGSYREKLAKGIAAAIREVLTEHYES